MALVQDYLGEMVQKKHSLTHTYPDHQPSFISIIHLLQSIAFSLFNVRHTVSSRNVVRRM